MKPCPLNQVLEVLEIPPRTDEIVTGFQIDSRSIESGNLFFALPGEKTDGHCHLEEVQRRGALGAVVSSAYQGPDFGLQLFRVTDVKEALQGLAREEVRRGGFRIGAVTGSVGKTTTKEFWAQLMQGRFRLGKTEGSQNTQLTLPLTLLNRAGDEEMMVLEMGMSKPGEMERLVDIAPPEVALLTKVALAHAAAFPEGVKEIAREKSQIFKGAKRCIFPSEFLEYEELVQEIGGEKITFSLTDRRADYFLSVETGILDERGVRAYQFDLPFREMHLLHNFLAAVCGARGFGVDWDQINAQVGHLRLPKMRFQQFEQQEILFVNDSYNSNPASVKAALECFPRPKEGGKKIGVFGPMAELGIFSEQMHAEMGRLAQKHADHLLVLGEDARPFWEGFVEGARPGEWFLDRKELVARLKELMRPGDVVLVKGRRSERMEEIFELLGH